MLYNSVTSQSSWINERTMNYSDHLMGNQNYRSLVFAINMSHLQTLEASYFHKGWSFFTFLETWQHHMNLLELWGLTFVFTFWLLYWDHLYSQNQGLMGMWISFVCGGTYTSWLMFSLFSLGCKWHLEKVCVTDQRWSIHAVKMKEKP